MDFTATTRLAAGPDRAWEAVADLSTYPDWLGIVAAAEAADAHPDDPGPAWNVVLQARLGPLARRKRLRMVRVDADASGPPTRATSALVRFERREQDGRAHGTWILTVEVRPSAPTGRSSSATAATGTGAAGTDLTVALHYGGAGWVPGLDLLLREEARRAGRRLDALLSRD